MKNFFFVMLKCKSDIYEKKDRLAAEAYLKVQKFVESGCYSSCKTADKIAIMSLKGHDIKVIAEKFNRSYDSIKHLKRSMSEELWGIFPEDFFDKLVDYRKNRQFINDCLYSLETFNYKSEDVILWDVLNETKGLSDDVVNDYTISDVSDELDFLMRYSKLFLDNELALLDMKKVKYLLDVIDGKSGSIVLRSEIMRKLKGSN